MDSMKALENRTLDSKVEMDILDTLDEIKAVNQRHEHIDTNKVLEQTVRLDTSLNAHGLTAEEEELVKTIRFKCKAASRGVGSDSDSDNDNGDGAAKLAAAPYSLPPVQSVAIAPAKSTAATTIRITGIKKKIKTDSTVSASAGVVGAGGTAPKEKKTKLPEFSEIVSSETPATVTTAATAATGATAAAGITALFGQYGGGDSD